MKKLSVFPIGFAFAGCFLGVGCMSGEETYQFFGTFGLSGIAGVLAAVTALVLLNLLIAYIVRKTGDARIDHVVVGTSNKTLLALTGTFEMLVFFGTYVVTAAGAGALLEMLTGLRGAHIWGAFLFCFPLLPSAALRDLCICFRRSCRFWCLPPLCPVWLRLLRTPLLILLPLQRFIL